MLPRTPTTQRTDCRVLAALANPLHPPEKSWVSEIKAAQEQLVPLADLNRTVLSLYENLKPYENFLPEDFRKRLEVQAHLRQSVRTVFDRELAKIARLLGEPGIRWMLIKTVRSFPREIRDLDILILDGDFKELKDVLGGIGYEVVEKKSGYKMGLRVYRRLEGSTRVPVSIDVHSRLGYEGLTFVDEEIMWGARRAWAVNGETVAVPSSEHQLLAMILNAFFGDGGLRLSDVFETESLLRDGVDMKEVLRRASRYGWTRSAEAVLSSCLKASQSLGVSGDGPRPEVDLPRSLPSYFSLGTLVLGLLEKAVHDFPRGGTGLFSSWARVGMKYASSLSRDRLLRDSWNQIFQR